MKIISRREHCDETSYHLFFEYEGVSGAGFAFDCDKNGIVNTSNFNTAKLANYNACMAGSVNGNAVLNRGIQVRHHTYINPAIGECECGKEVVLSNFTNTCYNCEADYNMSGQMLAPREQWGEETGESVSDILMANANCDV